MRTTFRLYALLALGFASAAAQPLTIEFSGIMTSFSSSTLRNAIGINSTFTATATFDPSASPTSSTGTQAVYSLTSFAVTVHGVTSGDWTATATSSLRNISVLNDTFLDEIQFSAVEASAPTFSGFTANTFNITLGGSNAMLSSTALPGAIANYDHTLWNPFENPGQTALKIYFNNNAQNAVFNITSVGAPSAIPEPSTYAAIAGTLALAGMMLRRRFTRAAA